PGPKAAPGEETTVPYASTILVLTRTDIEALRFRPEGVELFRRPDVLLVELPVLEPSQLKSRLVELGLLASGDGPGRYDPEAYLKVVRELDRLTLLRPGLTLVKSPYNPLSYAEISQAREAFALEKHFALMDLCASLGATVVKVQQVEIKSRHGTDVIDLS